MKTEQLEMDLRESRIDNYLDMIVSRLVNNGIGRSNYTTNGAIRAIRSCVGFTMLLDFVLDHEHKLVNMLPRYHRSDN